MISAKGFVDFARAMRRKLVLEISGLTPSEMPEGNPLIVKVAATTRKPRPCVRCPLFRRLHAAQHSPYAAAVISRCWRLWRIRNFSFR